LFDQLFSAFGGRGRSRGSFTGSQRGDDLAVSIGVSFMEAAKGTTRTVIMNPLINCTSCSGSGLKTGVKRSTCSSCGGAGTRTFVIDSGFQMASTCPTCQGAGSTIPRGGQCGECQGDGKLRTKKHVKIDIPAGAYFV